MATITTGGGGGLFGTLGGLATIGGALTGQPWLSALGTGLGMMNGQGGAGQQGGTGSSLADMLSGLFNNALGGGSISGKNTQQQQPQKTDAEIVKDWSYQNPYAHYMYGGNPWLR